MQDQLRRTLPVIKDVTISIEDIQFVNTGGEKPLQISLIGENLEDLRKATIAIKAAIQDKNKIMTTASTVLGMLPIALGIGAGSELRAPMAIAVMGGLVTSTLLSLIFVPVAYSLSHGLRKQPIRKSAP